MGPVEKDHIANMLSEAAKVDRATADELLPKLYDELRKLAASKLAQEKPGQTLQATALVHEAYLRLVGDGDVAWDGQGHFFAAAAEAMRRILIERAEAKQALKRGGGRAKLPLDDALAALEQCPDKLIDLNEALKQFEAQDSRKARLVKLRFFSGLTLEQAAEFLGISRATAVRDWNYARAWLASAIGDEEPSKKIGEP